MYKIGDSLEVTVTNIVDYGVFTVDEHNVRGLIHISEVSDHYVMNLHDYFKVGQVVEVTILDYDPKRGQLKLSYKSLNEVDFIRRDYGNKHEFEPLKEYRDSKLKDTKKRLGIKND